MADRRTFVIAGAGLAGAKAAETLREEGFDGRIVLVGRESEPPYERPPLSKGYLAGTSAREDAHVHPPGFYVAHDIDLLLGVPAVRLDPERRRVGLADGLSLTYDRLLIATGAVPRRLPIEGADLDGVHVLRTLADADTLRADLRPGARVAIVGAGWIGCEVAASARGLGAEVTLIEGGEVPLQRVLGRELGGLFADLHREHGVRLATGARVERLEGDDRVERVVLAGGSAVECDAVVLGVGVTPDTRLAAAGGLEVDDGIVAAPDLRTSVPGVFTAGDVASVFHPRYDRHVRVEHWSNALHQGPAAARSMLGHGAPYERLPSFFSDQYELGLEYVGLHGPADRLVLRRATGERRMTALWLDRDDRVTAGMHVDDWDAIGAITRLVESGAAIDPGRLADTGVPLDEVEPCRSR